MSKIIVDTDKTPYPGEMRWNKYTQKQERYLWGWYSIEDLELYLELMKKEKEKTLKGETK